MLGALALNVETSPNTAKLSPLEEMNQCLSRVASCRDKHAFETLYSFFGPRIKGFLLSAGVAADQAEDLAQETMLKVWRKAELFDPDKSSASTWIFTIARNLRIDALRRAAKPKLDPNEPALLPSEEPQADKLVERQDRDKILHEAFHALPENQLDVVRLHFLEDEPHSVIARRLDLPLGTVKSRLRLAFERIRKELGDFDA